MGKTGQGGASSEKPDARKKPDAFYRATRSGAPIGGHPQGWPVAIDGYTTGQSAKVGDLPTSCRCTAQGDCAEATEPSTVLSRGSTVGPGSVKLTRLERTDRPVISV